MSNTASSRAWLDIDLDALRANYRTLRDVGGPVRSIVPMVKADGYGIGAARVVRALEPLGPWGFGVATAEEGAALRSLGVRRPIVVFGPMPAQSVDLAASARLIAAISDLPALVRWVAAAAQHGPLDFHVDVDTGMGRAGFDWRETSRWSCAVRDRARGDARWTGIFTHFHGADAVDGMATSTQWQRFQDAIAQLPVSREDLMVHASNSAAALRWPEFDGDAVRPGIFLYGGKAAPAVAGLPEPAPVASLRARIVFVRDASPGSTVGYGATHVARGWERWATVAIGYGDGLPRALGNHGSALVLGRRVPIVGRISMDMTVVDITGVPPAAVGDVATFVGRDGPARIDVDEVAAEAGTISYELLTGITARVPRAEV
jgi:alanine racemase